MRYYQQINDKPKQGYISQLKIFIAYLVKLPKHIPGKARGKLSLRADPN